MNMANTMADTPAYDTRAARAAALRKSRLKSRGEALPRRISNRLADLAVKSWSKPPSNFSPWKKSDFIGDDGRNCLALGRALLVLRPTRQMLRITAYISKALRLALILVASGDTGDAGKAAQKMLKLNCSYEDLFKHAKAFMSAKHRRDRKMAASKPFTRSMEYSTPKGFILKRVATKADLEAAARALGNCLANDNFMKRHAMAGMRREDVAFFTLSNPDGSLIGLLEASKDGNAAWHATEFKGKANKRVPVPANSMSMLLEKAHVSVSDCPDLHGLGLADCLRQIIKSATFSVGRRKMRIDVASQAVRIITDERVPYLFERKEGWRILGSNAYADEATAWDLLTATQRFWEPIMVEQGTFQLASFDFKPPILTTSSGNGARSVSKLVTRKPS